MSLLEDRTAAFVVRIWRERGELPDSPREWRGMIEHVGSGQRAFFRELAAMVDFMKHHIASVGVDSGERFWESLETWLEPPGGPDADDRGGSGANSAVPPVEP